jgi:hypothetical protein
LHALSDNRRDRKSAFPSLWNRQPFALLIEEVPTSF